ncbi:MAG: M20 family metallopeptidase [Planctomycetota bacterium]|nr:M20 family metallopeptidase [Planctomycetota bacterium]
MSWEVTELLQQLVKIPSVNPMGRDVSGDEYYEYAVTDQLEQWFTELGVPWCRQTIASKRDNIIARIDGDRDPLDGGSILVFEAHQDTVPVEGMTIEPFDPVIREGRMYGRGSCDIKGGMSCMLSNFARCVQERPEGMPTLVMACSVNEEYGFSGAQTMAELWETDGWLAREPDGVIVAEPTLLDVVVAHKGTARGHCHAHGKAAHSSQPQLGTSAIFRMGHVLQALEKYAGEVVGTLGSHPLVGIPTISVGLIQGGISVNTVPDHCQIEIDRRVLPGDDAQAAYAHAVEYVQEYLRNNVPEGDAGIEFEDPYLAKPGLSDEHNSELATSLSSAIKECGHDGTWIGVPFGTDAHAFSSRDIPTVVFGPGSIDQAHTVDEWIEIDQLHQATAILGQFIQLNCS